VAAVMAELEEAKRGTLTQEVVAVGTDGFQVLMGMAH
jgi:hypothetical protein